MRDIAHFLRPAHLAQLRKVLDDPEASDNDRFVALDLLKNAVDRRRRRAADVPGHRHGDRQGQEGPVRLHRRRRRGGHRRGRPADVPDEQPALQPDGADHDVRGAQHRHQPAGRDQDLRRRRRRPTRSCSSPRAAAAPTSRTCTRRPRRCSTRRRCCRGSSRRCRRSARRPARRTTSPSSSAARRPSSPWRRPSWPRRTTSTRCPPTGSIGRPRLPRRRAGGQGPHAVAADRHRRPVRRQVLLPRRAHHPPPPPRRQLPGGDGRVVLGRPPGPGQDHRRRRVPRAAGDRSGPVPARGHRPARRDAGRAHRPDPADAGDPRRAVAVPGAARG